jgi:penicillin-insensitive murein endopeptidase
MNKINYIAILTISLISINVEAKESTCYGTTKNGRLENGVKLPSSGSNFKSYSSVLEIAGRTYVHSIVKKVVIESYNELKKINSKKRFKYAETGFENGGKFKPHKTHQNGLSIDFMVPVTDKNNKSVYFPTNILNKYGYNVNFNSEGNNKNYRIDFESLAAHIVTLNKAALNNNIELWRILFAPDLQNKLYATKYGNYIKNNIKIPTKKSWVRHDEHIHVDFKIKCKAK